MLKLTPLVVCAVIITSQPIIAVAACVDGGESSEGRTACSPAEEGSANILKKGIDKAVQWFKSKKDASKKIT